jgi:hypothetical protein
MAILLAAGLAIRCRLRNWGATSEELHSVLEGDDLVPAPADTSTLAVTVAAPPEDVWAWLVQIGQDRGGMYSYDLVENLLGLGIHSAGELRKEWQQLRVGDRVWLVPNGWCGISQGVSLPVARLDPGRSLVLREQPPELPWNSVWSFHVIPTDGDSCRLLSRTRTARRRGPARWADEVMNSITSVMTRRMLLGIKARAEDHCQVSRLAA